ncbi:FMN-binding negative transcriptional regulator [Robertkochia marina]|uniref:FMN-binding negative transcriptional regulator n=1 Tax=Robertkochia marina TaxID=1227945 RepID=A0A4S3M3I9_9FLAO|nr:FMN-binding negative transcriptional regulator [Robertkochia marina]THD69676.1 FMN-binding negative transcriptional regulator [Robertkochia marina]TRZ46978.1 FMN-binding negative transcriptional regulator [Robertkochia marina]
MYQHFEYKDYNPDTITKFIADFPFAVISGCDLKYNPVATQAPVFLEEQDGKKLLRGHMIKGSEHHKAFTENNRVMVLFPGPDTYVSATWYSGKQSASTWNYMTVQAKGTIRFPGEEQLIEILRKTTLHFENNNGLSPTTFDNLGPEYTQRLLHAITAFEVEVHDLDHVFKLSQDMDEESFENIIKELKNGNAAAQSIAGEMEKRKQRLFDK